MRPLKEFISTGVKINGDSSRFVTSVADDVDVTKCLENRAYRAYGAEISMWKSKVNIEMNGEQVEEVSCFE